MESMVLFSITVVVLTGLSAVGFILLKLKMVQENLSAEEQQLRILDESKNKAAT